VEKDIMEWQRSIAKVAEDWVSLKFKKAQPLL